MAEKATYLLQTGGREKRIWGWVASKVSRKCPILLHLPHIMAEDQTVQVEKLGLVRDKENIGDTYKGY